MEKKNTLNVSGTFEADVTLSGRKNDKGKVTAEIVVIDGKGVSLLGKETSEKLGVLRVGLHSDVVGSLSEKPERNGKYKSLYSGLGKLKEQKITFRVKQNVKPVIQAGRRIPFSLRLEVEEKSQSLRNWISLNVQKGLLHLLAQ